ncbi:hypothetical protein R3X27_01710 [Tropicimonas sp. TH_r6]|uniref:hypothetical protein n=1 Tax=Tropicimonas sp. TH_r6 TaxID=3082085 RepID=UPI0029548A23|nr:hypothetical protein [Tropicimonas sp. TH_r6]MDV7141391.1 hypothetical protein [Tropicimonas sp. TH_r6]
MSSDRTKDEFAERLRRIEAKRRAATPGYKPPRLPDFSNLPEDKLIRSAPRRGIGAGGVMLGLMSFMACVGVAAAYVLRDDLPFEVASLTDISREASLVAKAGVQALGGPVSLVAQKEKQPEAPLKYSDDGRILRSPLVATAWYGDVAIDEVVNGFQPNTSDTFPASVTTYEPAGSCVPRPLGTGESLANIRIDRGGPVVGVQSFSNAALADRLLRNVEAEIVPGKAYDKGGRLSPEMRVVDVFLTDLSAPQYVVLQNLSGAILWNLQPAPGVEIAHVLMISPGGSAVSTGSDTLSVQALRTGDFVSKADFESIRVNYRGDPPENDCFISPWRKPQEHWLGWQKAQKQNMLFVNRIHTFTHGHARFDEWFTRSFGQSAADGVVAADEAAHVLVGPVPEATFAYVPLQERPIWMLNQDHIVIGNAAARAEEIESIHWERLTAALGGDASRLNPAPKRAGQ